MSVTLRERLLSRLVVDLEEPRTVDDAPCWLWTGMQNGYGYGLIKVGGRKGRRLLTHRVAYELLRGPVPDGLQLDHLCRVRHCANPAHLEPVTCRGNLLRGNTIQARNAAKTHCDSGHEFTPENTRRVPAGRQCRTCQRDYDREYKRQRRAAASGRA